MHLIIITKITTNYFKFGNWKLTQQVYSKFIEIGEHPYGFLKKTKVGGDSYFK